MNKIYLTHLILLLVFAAPSTVVASLVQDQVGLPPILVAMDENGNGLFKSGDAPPETLDHLQGQDPGPGGLPNALIYYHYIGGLTMTAGDLILTEGPLDRTNVWSDLIRFNFTPGTGSWVFYSDLPEPGESAEPADIGFPLALYPNVLIRPESGEEGGWNGFEYTPAPGQPGYLSLEIPGVISLPVPITYKITSDIPEPSTLVMLAGLGVMLISGYGWRKGAA